MNICGNKKRILDSVRHQPLDRIPTMCRALPAVNQRLLSYFSIDGDIKDNWQELLKKLDIECFSSGAGMGKFTTYRPLYKGGRNIYKADGNMFYAWGIGSYYDEKSDSISYMDNKEPGSVQVLKYFLSLTIFCLKVFLI